RRLLQLVLGPTALHGLRWIEAREMLADDLLRAIAFDVLCPGIPRADIAFVVENEDRVVDDALDEQPEALFESHGFPGFQWRTMRYCEGGGGPSVHRGSIASWYRGDWNCESARREAKWMSGHQHVHAQAQRLLDAENLCMSHQVPARSIWDAIAECLIRARRHLGSSQGQEDVGVPSDVQVQAFILLDIAVRDVHAARVDAKQ